MLCENIERNWYDLCAICFDRLLGTSYTDHKSRPWGSAVDCRCLVLEASSELAVIEAHSPPWSSRAGKRPRVMCSAGPFDHLRRGVRAQRSESHDTPSLAGSVTLREWRSEAKNRALCAVWGNWPVSTKCGRLAHFFFFASPADLSERCLPNIAGLTLCFWTHQTPSCARGSARHHS